MFSLSMMRSTELFLKGSHSPLARVPMPLHPPALARVTCRLRNGCVMSREMYRMVCFSKGKSSLPNSRAR